MESLNLYVTGNSWETINGKNYPQYDINYIESEDGINIQQKVLSVYQTIKGN